MAGEDPGENVDPGDLLEAGNTVVAERLQVCCIDFDEASEGEPEVEPSVVIAFHGETLLGGEASSARVMIRAEYWPTLDRLVSEAIAAAEGRVAEVSVDDSYGEGHLEAVVHADRDYEFNEVWWPLFMEVMEVVDVLEPGQFLILSAPGNRFVQVFVDDEGAQVESVSNLFLAPDCQLGFDALDRLEELGWSSPTHHATDEPLAEGATPNHFRNFEDDWSPESVAALMVTTLRDVHRVAFPLDLTYSAGSIDGEVILLPTLTLPRASL